MNWELLYGVKDTVKHLLDEWIGNLTPTGCTIAKETEAVLLYQNFRSLDPIDCDSYKIPLPVHKSNIRTFSKR